MLYRRYRRYRKRSNATTRRKPYRKYSKKRPTVAKVKRIVKQTIARNIENKTIQYYSGTSPLLIRNVESSGFSGTNVISIAPNPTTLTIQQGVGQAQRIGNRIKIKNAYVSGTIFPSAYDGTANPLPQPTQVIMWILYDKSAPTESPDPTADFFQKGNTVTGMDGTLQDLYSPINTDKYRVFTKRIFKIGYAGVTGTGNYPEHEYFMNNDFKLNVNFKINITKYLIKRVKYVDTALNPTTRGLWLMLEPVASNGSSWAAAGVPCRWFYNISMTYEDA